MVNILRNDINKSKFSLDDVMLSLKGPVPTLSFLEEEKKTYFSKEKEKPSLSGHLSQHPGQLPAMSLENFG